MVVWIWWAAITRLCIQRLEHILRWDLRIRHGRPSKSRLLFSGIGGLPRGLLKSYLLLDEAVGGLWLDCRLPEACGPPVALLESLCVVVWVARWEVALAEGERTEGTSCSFGHVRLVCTSTERVAGCVRPLLEATTAAALRPPWADLPSLSALTILRASMNEMLFSAFTCWTLFSKSHLWQLLLKAEWLPVQLGHFG